LRNSPVRIGILGGGQLARMLTQSSHQLGLETWIFCESKIEPAAQVTSNFQIGSLKSDEEIIRFLESVDRVTFESEFVPVEILERIMKENSALQSRLTFFPHLNAMKLLQDRKTQKQFLMDHKLPTSENTEALALDSIEPWSPLVLKKRMGGYDGYGTFIFKRRDQFEVWLKGELKGTTLSRSDFIKKNFIAEKWIPFRRELAFSIARDGLGRTVTLPLVETHQTQSRCDWVIGPVRHPRFRALEKKIRTALKAINYVGIIAFELFDTGKDLLINEVAPRVHNSAHHSQESMTLSQFDLHLLCGTNEGLPAKVTLRSPFAMLNLLGTSPEKLSSARSQITGKIHWYGKTEARPGRKMGHINYLAESKINIKSLIKEREKHLPHQMEKQSEK
jgi:5-(carboxyamino)imidazole ribonucleotide synthase